MSLLQKASIITTPTAYAEDYLYSIKPAYALGSELVTNGDFSNGTNNWTPNANATLSVENGRLKVAISGAGSGYPSQDITTEVGKKYRITANAFIGTSTKVSLYSVVFGFNDLSVDGSYDLTFKATSTTTQIRLYVYGDGTYGFWDNVSVKEVTDADFDFDRNSTGTRVNEDYLIEDVPYNLVSNSENFSVFTKVNATVTTNQTLAPDGTLTADKIVFNGTANARVEQNLTASIMGTPNTQSVFLKTESGTANIDIGLATHDVTTVAVTSEWKRFTHTGEGQYPRMKSDSAVTIFAWGMQVVKGDQPKDYLKTTDRLDIPRIDYTNGEPSILLEPSRTNKLPYSQDFTDSGWLKSGSTISTGFLSPEGINNASKVTATNTDPYLLYSVSGITDLIYAASIYIKGTSTSIGKTARLWIIRDNVVFHSEDFTITNIWQRISTTKTFTTTPTGFVSFRVDLPNTDVAVGNETLIYGAQLEVGSYPTSLIHTSGSAVTRSADSATNAGNSDLFNPSAGCLYIETAALTNDYQMFYSINDGTNDNRIIIRYNSSGESINVFSINSLSSTGFSHTLIDLKEFNKIALNYNSSNLKLYVNGSLANSAVSPQLPSALTRFNFSNQVTDQEVFAKTKMVAVFKEALTDLELEKLTGYNNHELYMNYYNRLSYLGLAEEYNVESDINNYILWSQVYYKYQVL